ncbi:MAG: cryptochrome/photolyase family protein [Bacteroidetes bacterium]|nr:MAG: cryptochrome/photolyase family protein [Bacteroidota bacterium]REK31998.1 MAG: cryptochrome/photolyase family protein [Bacteroidota bacterium]REK50062.1 MAG: cryptochrome/photolyase family protein [Bacteroidota bacterium]
MKNAHIVFPHQLFSNTGNINRKSEVFIVEEYLFFRQYKFHQQKIAFNRATMKAYADYLSEKGFKCTYIESVKEISDLRKLIPWLSKNKFNSISFHSVSDFWLEERLVKGASKYKMNLSQFESSLFLNSREQNKKLLGAKKKYNQTSYYINQRKHYQILLDKAGKALKGKWTFDTDNRKKYPDNQKAPLLPAIKKSAYHIEADEYVKKHYRENYGKRSQSLVLPVTGESAKIWYLDFLKNRFQDFGAYEDAIVKDAYVLNHSFISPLLNCGLLDPAYVIDEAIEFAQKNKIPYNSLEGFVRQILGWREFANAVYLKDGSKQRTRNFWKFKRKIPGSFYTGSTGIGPLDDCIHKALDHAYNHHIERLMILSNFMLLCEFDPDLIYQWFMEMYIDSYDWVMVPNVYGMGQFADGGLMCGKPYISGSNYILKMSNYERNEAWAETWDALFWRFINVNRKKIKNIPRMSMLINTFDRMKKEKQEMHMKTANKFLRSLA